MKEHESNRVFWDASNLQRATGGGVIDPGGGGFRLGRGSVAAAYGVMLRFAVGG